VKIDVVSHTAIPLQTIRPETGRLRFTGASAMPKLAAWANWERNEVNGNIDIWQRRDGGMPHRKAAQRA
jgi:hypothetical protein